MLLLEDKRWFAYAFLDIRKTGEFNYSNNFIFNFEPFYIGISRRQQRPLDHFRNAFFRNVKTNHFINKIRKIKEETNKNPEIIIIKNCLNMNEALELEKNLINMIGRIDLKTGPLTNKCDGGRGSWNYIITEETRKKIGEKSRGRKHSEETKRRIRESTKGINKGKKLSLFQKNKISQFGKTRKHSEETKRRIRESTKGINKGRKFSEEHCKKMKELRKKFWIILNNKIQVVYGLKEWCKKNNIVYSTFRKYQNKQKSYQNY